MLGAAALMEEAQGYRLAGAAEVQGLRRHHAQHWVREQQEDAAPAPQRCAAQTSWTAAFWGDPGEAKAAVLLACQPAPPRFDNTPGLCVHPVEGEA